MVEQYEVGKLRKADGQLIQCVDATSSGKIAKQMGN